MSTTVAPAREASSNRARQLNRGAQTCETAIKRAGKERSEQLNRLQGCLHKELTFRVKPSHGQRVYIRRRRPTLDGCATEPWGVGDPSFCPAPRVGANFTATVTRAGIDDLGRSYVVVGVSAAQEIKQEAAQPEYLLPAYEYQLFLDRIAVVGGLD